MSHHLLGAPQRTRVLPTTDNPYQTTIQPRYNKSNAHQKSCKDCQRKPCCDETCLSEDNFTDTNTYYDFYQDHGYYTGRRRETHTDCIYSEEESGSTRLPYYEYEDLPSRRHSRNTFSESLSKKGQQVKLNPVLPHRDARRVYPNQEARCETFCPDQRRVNVADRPQSSQSSGVASAIVDGCGGHCQTFENVCYYFLQVAFTMGILIGASLCIAGALLRKSAARNLQVLVYIGALLFFVSALLLGVQCSARKAARKRRKALKGVKRNVIPMETLSNRNVPIQQQQQQPLMVDTIQRSLPTAAVAVPNQMLAVPPVQAAVNEVDSERSGVPWWRRKDVV